MRASWNWLQEFVELDSSPASVAERLSMAGLEVERIERVGEHLSEVVIGEVLAIRQSPASAGLLVCDVRAGGEVPVVVLTFLTGLRPGARVPLAPLGATLAGGRKVELVEQDGVRSFGQLCSEQDLGLGPEADRVFDLGDEAPVGMSVGPFLRLDDYILEISITPNRGDCLSILGLAREIGALTGARLKRPRLRLSEHEPQTRQWIAVRVADPVGCRRYVARVVTDVRVGPSPLWMQQRLRNVGLRPINNVVDVTNYVLWERGQPLHAFDYDRLPVKDIVVDRAGVEMSFVTLDGEERLLRPDDLLIFSGANPVALAGIMGGANSEVTETTRTVLLESAWFSPVAVRRTARRLGLRTEASYRFERVVDIEGVPTAADQAAALLADLCGGRAACERIDVYPQPAERAPIALRLRRVEECLGIEVNRQFVVGAFKRLGMEVSSAPRGVLSVVPPAYRSDLEREIDLVEEVARMLGYEKIPLELPRGAVANRGLGELEGYARNVRRFFVAQGLCEVVPLSFVSSEENQLFPGLVLERKAVTLLNPLSQNDAEMRLSLCSSLARVARHNLAQGAEAVALFLLGKVFWQGQPCGERLHVGGVICPRFPEQGIGLRQARAEFAEVKGVLESLLELLGIEGVEWGRLEAHPSFHPGQSAELRLEGERLAVVGALHPGLETALELPRPCWLFELDLETGLQYRPRRITFREWPRFPEVKRDLAIVADRQFLSGEVVRFVREYKVTMPWVEKIELVDEYAGPPIPEGKKSLTYSVSYRLADRTLTDAEVNQWHFELSRRIVERFGVEPR